MARFAPIGKREKIGSAPGSAIYVGKARTDAAYVEVFDYSVDGLEESRIHGDDLDALAPLRTSKTTTWINVVGVHDVLLVRTVAEYFGLHSLAVEDILNTDQRPKLEEEAESVMVVVKLPSSPVDDPADVAFEQVSIVIGDGWVVSFQEFQGDPFEPLRRRLREGAGRLRRRRSDYLGSCLLDCLVDAYFPVLERIGDELAQIEMDFIDDPEKAESISRSVLHRHKRALLLLRKAVTPLRDPLSALRREATSLIGDDTLPFLSDVYDHCLHVLESVEALRELATGVMDLQNVALSNRMNEVMKVLTVISTMFIPLSFLAGLYGMNFAYIPELQWHYSYFVLLGVMAVCVAVMLTYFRRKHWI